MRMEMRTLLELKATFRTHRVLLISFLAFRQFWADSKLRPTLRLMSPARVWALARSSACLFLRSPPRWEVPFLFPIHDKQSFPPLYKRARRALPGLYIL